VELRAPRKWRIVFIGAISLVGIVALFIFLPHRGYPSIRLSNGSTLRLEGVTYGTNVFVGGHWLHRAIFKGTGRVIDPKFLRPVLGRPFLPRFGAPYKSGSITLNFSLNHKKDAGQLSGSGGRNGAEVNGVGLRLFDSEGTMLECSRISGFGHSETKAYSTLTFSLPKLTGDYFRLETVYPLGANSQTNEYLIPSPIPKNERR
jgi:hypothetical protein